MKLSQNEFEQIVQLIAQETPCCEGVETNGNTVIMRWRSNKGIIRSQRYYFNNIGCEAFEEFEEGTVLGWPPPPPGSTVPGIFFNKLMNAVYRKMH